MLYIAKAFVVGSIALLFSLLAFNNLTDFENNRSFFENIMNLKTVDNPNIAYRAVENPNVHLAAYGAYIFAQIATAVLCWIGAYKILKGDTKVALLGLLCAFLTYMLVFVVFASEWFNIWQSQFASGQIKAIAFATLFLVSMIFVNQKSEG